MHTLGVLCSLLIAREHVCMPIQLFIHTQVHAIRVLGEDLGMHKNKIVNYVCSALLNICISKPHPSIATSIS